MSEPLRVIHVSEKPTTDDKIKAVLGHLTQRRLDATSLAEKLARNLRKVADKIQRAVDEQDLAALAVALETVDPVLSAKVGELHQALHLLDSMD